MFKKLKNDRTIRVYGLCNRNDMTNFYTITNSIDDCKEYASKIFKYERAEHFKSWCELKGIDPEDQRSWDEYYENCVLPADKNEYVIQPMDYKWKDILAILRMFAGSIPLNCSFDTPSEIAYYKTIEETRLAFTKYTEKYCEEIKEQESNSKKGYDA